MKRGLDLQFRLEFGVDYTTDQSCDWSFVYVGFIELLKDKRFA